MRKMLCLLLTLCFICAQSFGQSRTVTGTVTDEKGNPIPRASVLVRGTQIGTSTNDNGRYTISVPAKERVLIISSVGLTSKEITIGPSEVVNAQLLVMDKSMDEVIVVAYGTVKKGENTASSAQITAKDITNRPISNVTNALVGSAPGIQTTSASGQPGSGPTIRLRGYTSYSSGNTPLIVLDGVAYDGGLGNINPEDVESISTLKDAASGALYGSRGANGVIVITTKRGSKGRSNLTFKAVQGSTDRALPEYDRVNAFQYYPLMWEAYKNNLVYTSGIPVADAANIASGVLPRFTTGANIGKQNYNGVAYSDVNQQLGYNPFTVASSAIVLPNGTINPDAKLLYGDDLDWVKQSTQKGSRSEYDLSYNGGAEKADYMGSFSYTDEKGWSSSATYKRFTGRVGVNVQPLKWFKTGFNISGNLTNSNQTPTSGIVNPFYFARYIAPIYPVYNHNQTTGAYVLDGNGNKTYDYGNNPSRPYNTGRHTIAENLWNLNTYKRNSVNARSYAEISILPELKLTTNISVDAQDNYTESFDNPTVGDGAPSGRAGREFIRTTSYTFNQLLNYSKRFGDHTISFVGGHENYDYSYNYLYGFKTVQVVDGITELVNFSTVSSLTSYTNNARIESYLSKANYDYKGKYILSGSFRRDGNSKFSRAVRWANFWSVGAAWRIDKELFMDKFTWIDGLKLRSSYGKVGNDQVGNYPYQSFYDLGRNNANEPGFVQGTLGNDSLTWETSKNFDVALEFSLFKNRISGTVEYFNRVTDGLIFSVPQPLSNGGTTSGALSVNQNIGNLYNKGLEVQLIGDIVRSKNFKWTMTINATTFSNKVTSMPALRPKIQSGTKQLEVGHSIYDFYLRHYYGVDPSDGAALFANVVTKTATSLRYIDNGKGSKDTVTTDVTNSDYRYNGTSIPKVYGSIGNTFTYKNFDLSFLFTYQIGGKVYDAVYASLMSSGVYGTTLSTDMLGRWQKAGDITNVPRMDNSKTAVYSAQTDRFLTDASYFSLNNINIGYSFTKGILSKITAKGARIYLSGENLFVASKRRGMDVNGTFSGVTADSFSLARILSAGINVNF